MKQIIILFILGLSFMMYAEEDLFCKLGASMKEYDDFYKTSVDGDVYSNSIHKTYKVGAVTVYVYFDKKTKESFSIIASNESDFTDREIHYILEDNWLKGVKWQVHRASYKKIYGWILSNGRVQVDFISTPESEYRNIAITKPTFFDEFKKHGMRPICYDESEYEYKDLFDIRKNKNSYELWKTYLKELKKSMNGGFEDGRFIPCFSAKVAGFEALIEKYMDLKKQNPTYINDYLKILVRVKEAGFLKEYIWKYYMKPSKNLKISRFESWAKSNLSENHLPKEHAYIKRIKIKKDAPGENDLFVKGLDALFSEKTDGEK